MASATVVCVILLSTESQIKQLNIPAIYLSKLEKKDCEVHDEDQTVVFKTMNKSSIISCTIHVSF